MLQVCACTAWCNEIGSLMSQMHVTQVHPVTTENQFHCTRLYSDDARVSTRIQAIHTKYILRIYTQQTEFSR